MDEVNPPGSGWLAPAYGMDEVNPPGSGWLAPAYGMDEVNPSGITKGLILFESQPF
jgi:hypothetical protein